MVWKNGLIGHDYLCNYQIRFNESKVMLTVRSLHPEKQFNMKSDACSVLMEKVSMELLLFLEYLLVKNNIAHYVRKNFIAIILRVNSVFNFG